MVATMTSVPITDHLVKYAQRIRDLRRANLAVSEPALAPAFQERLNGWSEIEVRALIH